MTSAIFRNVPRSVGAQGKEGLSDLVRPQRNSEKKMMPWPGLKGPKGLPNAGGPREWGWGIIPGEGDNMGRVWGHVIPVAMKYWAAK